MTVDGNVGENWRRGDVHVPERMGHQLEGPSALTGFQIDTDQAFAKEIISRPVPAIEVSSGRFNRQIDQPSLFINSDLRPHPGVTGIFSRPAQPRFVAKLALFGDRV